MTARDLQISLNEPMTPALFDALLNRLKATVHTVSFDALLTVVLAPEKYGHDQWASRLLVELDPPCPHSLEQILIAISSGQLDPSNRLLPFYLIAQFGRVAVHRAVRELRGGAAAPNPLALGGIAYWLNAPMVELIDSHIHWFREWRGKAEPTHQSDTGRTR